jgi:hypothetical protein
MDHLVVAHVLASNRERALQVNFWWNNRRWLFRRQRGSHDCVFVQMLGRTLQAQLEVYGPKDGRFRITLDKIKLLRNERKSDSEVIFELQRALAISPPPIKPKSTCRSSEVERTKL